MTAPHTEAGARARGVAEIEELIAFKKAAYEGLYEGWNRAQSAVWQYRKWMAENKREMRGLKKRLETAQRRAATRPHPPESEDRTP